RNGLPLAYHFASSALHQDGLPGTAVDDVSPAPFAPAATAFCPDPALFAAAAVLPSSDPEALSSRSACTCCNQQYPALRPMPRSIGKSTPGAMASEVAMAFNCGGRRFAAAQAAKPAYPSPYMPTWASLHGCLAIQAITARARSPSCSNGITCHRWRPARTRGVSATMLANP